MLQKARTRDALVAVTRQLMRAGVTPTVEQAADVARVSRATAYRYFPSQRALLAATFPHLEGGSLLVALVCLAGFAITEADRVRLPRSSLRRQPHTPPSAPRPPTGAFLSRPGKRSAGARP